MEDHPYSVQMLSNATWQRTKGTATAKAIEQGLEDLMDQYTILYQRMVDDLTTPQLKYLEAMADGVEQFTAAETITRYEFGSSALVSRLRQALEKKDILDHQGKRTVWIDPLFKIWLENRFWRKPKRAIVQ